MKKYLLFTSCFWVANASLGQYAPSIEWQLALGSSGQDRGGEGLADVQRTVDGGYFVIGTCSENDGNVSGFHGGTDIWVVKLDANGSLMWQHPYGGSDLDVGYSVDQTSDGGYILAGKTESDDGDVFGLHSVLDDAWIVKLDSTGTIEWQRCLGGTGHDVALSVSQLSDGGYIVAGATGSFEVVDLNWTGF